RLGRMIDDLLDASRIEASRLSISPRAIDLRALVETVAEAAREAGGENPIEVSVGAGQAAVVGPDRIHQVLIKLISNAAKYGDPGAPIRVAATNHDEVVEVTVTNHGPGIPADQLPLLFTRFGRTREARENETPGIGLGLYISKGLVEAHGGRMWVE